MEALRETVVWIPEVVVDMESKGCVWKWNKQDLLS